MPLSRECYRKEQNKSDSKDRLYRLRGLIRRDGRWGNETEVVLLRWHNNTWKLWKGKDPIT